MLHILIRLSIRVKVFIFAFALLSTSVLFGNAEEEIITAIILINSQAELVDMDQEGEILRRHLAIPDYFSSGRSHKNSLRRSLNQIKDYGFIEDYSIPGSSDLPAICLQSSMNEDIGHEEHAVLVFETSAHQPFDFPQVDVISDFEVFGVMQRNGIKIIRHTPLSKLSMGDSFFPTVFKLQIPQQLKQRYKKDKRFSNGDFSNRLS